MYRKKVFKASLCISAVLVSLGLSHEVSASTNVGSDVGIAGITPVIQSYYSANSEEEYGEAEEYLMDLLIQLDQVKGSKLTEVISPYVNLGISIANDFVNIRTEPNVESEIAGKLYSGCATDILEREDDWVKIKSGNVEGYIKSEFLAIGKDAEGIIEDVADKYAIINTQTLYVREEPTTDSDIATMVPLGEKYYIEEEQEEWAKISIDDISGYVAKDYIDIDVEFDYAISIEEEQARIAAEEAARRAEEERLEQLAREEEARAEASRREANRQTSTNTNTQTQAATSAPKKTQAPAAPSTSSQGTARGQEIANYALNFVGNPYKYGGTSLTNGADCSGFVWSVYKHFGYSIPRTSSGQGSSAGYQVSVNDRQPGDIIAYYGHVGIYIGNNKIVHASNEKTGIKISTYNYRSIRSVRRVAK